MATYYVDYENVHNGGIKGIEEADSNALVYIMYSVVVNTMTVESIKKILASNCQIEFIETSHGTANALDFQLIALLFATIESDDYHYIISNDKGFDAAIAMGKRIGYENVARFNTIYGAVKDYDKKLVEHESAEDSEETTSEPDYVEQIATAIENAASATEEPVSVFAEKIKETAIIEIQKIIEEECDITLTKESLDITYDGISKSSTKMELYKYLRHNLGDKSGRMIYGAVSGKWGELIVLAS